MSSDGHINSLHTSDHPIGHRAHHTLDNSQTTKHILILQLNGEFDDGTDIHVTNIYQKMGVESRTAAAAKAYELRR